MLENYNQVLPKIWQIWPVRELQYKKERKKEDLLEDGLEEPFRDSSGRLAPRVVLLILPQGRDLWDLYMESGQTLQGSFSALSKPIFCKTTVS